MTAKTMLAIGVGAFAVAAGAPAAFGRLVTFEFAGEVTYVQDDNAILPEGVGIGSSFSGQYTFDGATPDASPDAPSLGYYPNAITDMRGWVDAVPFDGPSASINSISVLNDFGSSGFDSYGVDVHVSFLGEMLKCSVGFEDSSGGVLLDDSLPTSAPVIDLVDVAGFSLAASSEDFYLAGELTSLVPEPGTLGLLALGAIGLGRR